MGFYFNIYNALIVDIPLSTLFGLTWILFTSLLRYQSKRYGRLNERNGELGDELQEALAQKKKALELLYQAYTWYKDFHRQVGQHDIPVFGMPDYLLFEDDIKNTLKMQGRPLP